MYTPGKNRFDERMEGARKAPGWKGRTVEERTRASSRQIPTLSIHNRINIMTETGSRDRHTPAFSIHRARSHLPLRQFNDPFREKKPVSVTGNSQNSHTCFLEVHQISARPKYWSSPNTVTGGPRTGDTRSWLLTATGRNGRMPRTPQQKPQ